MTDTKLEFIRSELSDIATRRRKIAFLIPEIQSIHYISNEIEKMNIPIVNTSLYLSEQLKIVAPDHRPFKVSALLRKLINDKNREIVCLYNIEYLFDPELQVNPVKLLEANSGNTVLLVLWPGKAKQGVLYYAAPEHPEYYKNTEYGNSILFY
ncbi:BREX-3 system P-loop-containing protein BrxF [Paenibacillus sp. FSL R7-0272]|uniref:BREX-3 system P-loop-containing protein BrxF n=1 Tax=Paenibacillus sp. FSL R7-0272 TaxID=2921679 RepID=UPI0030DA0C7C